MRLARKHKLKIIPLESPRAIRAHQNILNLALAAKAWSGRYGLLSAAERAWARIAQSMLPKSMRMSYVRSKAMARKITRLRPDLVVMHPGHAHHIRELIPGADFVEITDRWPAGYEGSPDSIKDAAEEKAAYDAWKKRRR